MKVIEVRKVVLISTFIAMIMILAVDCYCGVIEKGPYLQNVGKDHITIMWETLYATKGRVEYGLTEDYGLFVESSEKTDIHEVTLRALMPGTQYYYKIASGYSTKSATFRTAPDHEIPVKFVVYGDSQANPDIHESIAKDQLFPIHKYSS